MSETHLDLALRTRTVAGATAGNLTVAGIRVGDALKAVQRVDAAGANLVEEFTITADNTINNAGGTSTATGVVLVIWIAKSPVGGRLDRE
jgi:hypothetical protein